MRIKSLFLIIILSFSTSFADNKQNDKASLFIENFTHQIFDIMTNENSSHAEIIAALSYEIKQNIDLGYICNFVIGRKWKTANPEFKKKFYELYEKYLISLYAPQFKGYGGETYKIIKTEEIRENRFSSQIVFISKDKTQINLNVYFIRNDKNEFKIVDVTGEGISIIASQREEFNSVISMYGLDYFLESFQEKIQMTN